MHNSAAHTSMIRKPSIHWNEHNTHGRESEIAEIRAILKQIDSGAPSRIVAITGPSGVGKVHIFISFILFNNNLYGYTIHIFHTI
jgi:Cdc6-like AAA superfamily ATPase